MQSTPFQKEFMDPHESMGFSRFDLDYWKTPQLFSEFISGLPDMKSVIHQIKDKSDFKNRKQIVSILRNQYQSFDVNSKVFNQIKKLEQANTFTVICAHQPCLFGGPMFWIYKILSTIKLCEILAVNFQEYHFVPVYFSGNEDHDFEEINHIQVFQNKLFWKEQSGVACGRLPVSGLNDVMSDLNHLFQRSDAARIFLNKNHEWIEKSTNYGEYFRYFVHELFGDRGLVYFNPDDREAKSLFSPVISKELLEGFVFQHSMETSQRIQKMQYPLQVNPRELNLFLHHDSGRKRLARKEEGFQLIDTEFVFSEVEIFDLLKNEPDRFSPNVLLRPLYQEFLFPNIAFVGGGGEIAYWMQLKKCFEAVAIPYPLLFRRFSAFYFDQSLLNKISKSPFEPEDYLNPLHELEKSFVQLYAVDENGIDKEVREMILLLDKIRLGTSDMEASTKMSIESELQKIQKSLEHILSKQNKAIKQKYDLDLQAIRKIKEQLFPSNSIQERVQSFLPNYFENGDSYLEIIAQSYSPELPRLGLIMENKILKM